MSKEKKTLMVGLGPAVDDDWNPKVLTKGGAERHMERHMPEDLKRHKFEAVVSDCGGYWRGSYGKSLEGAPWRR